MIVGVSQCVSNVACVRDVLLGIVLYGVYAGALIPVAALVSRGRYPRGWGLKLLGAQCVVLLLLGWALEPRWLHLARAYPTVMPTEKPIQWRASLPGFELAELPVTLGADQVDEIGLIRIDPKLFRVVVRHDSRRPREAHEWRADLGALAVVNGSYYVAGGGPETPLRVDGVDMGPAEYHAEHGAFLADPLPTFAVFHGDDPWKTIRAAKDAFVSYPLLLEPDGRVRAKYNPRWLANRSFIGEDRSGRIIIGTTRTGFFSLWRLGAFLRESSLHLTTVLNLDGGPIASQSALDGEHSREMRGTWELTDESNLITEIWDARRGETKFWKLPIVLAVLKREASPPSPATPVEQGSVAP